MSSPARRKSTVVGEQSKRSTRPANDQRDVVVGNFL
jgi:hypothetical protein